MHKTHVLGLRHLTPSTFVLRLERRHLPLTAGQAVSLSFPHETLLRDYSVYSGVDDPWIDLLIKEVEDGQVSPRLKACRPGDELLVSAPRGEFIINAPDDDVRHYVFIASGTGIAPYHSYVRSYPHLDYELLHGIRYSHESYDAHQYGPEQYRSCVTRDEGGDFHGRVTDYLRANPPPAGSHCYLCGNCDMIYEAYHILLEQGVPTELIYTEVYF